MAAHILGNGPSIELFDRSDWPDEDTYIGCNFSDESLRPDYTVMVDRRPMMRFFEGLKVNIPMILSDKAYKAIENGKGWHRLPEGAINYKETIPFIKWNEIHEKYGLNSGQHAAMYAAEQGGFDHVHLWGIDSFWSDSLKSKSDAIVRPNAGERIKPEVADPWRKYWRAIFRKKQNTLFTIHAPYDIILVDNYSDLDNVKQSFHK